MRNWVWKTVSRLKERLLPPFRHEKKLLLGILHPWEWLIAHGDNKRWGEWVNSRDPQFEDLVQLLRNQHDPFFQARAMLVLLVPDWQWLPIHWQSSWDRCVKRNWFPRGINRGTLQSLHPKVRHFCADLLAAFIKYLNAHPRIIPDQHLALNAYNNYVLDLLTIGQPMCITEQLMNCFSVRSYQAADSSYELHFGRADEFEPLRRLLADSEICSHCKRIADQTMRQYINDAPEPDGVMRSYGVIVFSLPQDFAVPSRLFTDQVEFIVRHPLASCVSITPEVQELAKKVLFRKGGMKEEISLLNRLADKKPIKVDFS